MTVEMCRIGKQSNRAKPIIINNGARLGFASNPGLKRVNAFPPLGYMCITEVRHLLRQ